MKDQYDVATLGASIKKIRNQRGMSQADLATAANLSLPQISLIERGKTVMKLDTFVRVVKALQASADELLCLDVPQVKNAFTNEFNEILHDCSTKELEQIIRITKEIKSAMRAVKE